MIDAKAPLLFSGQGSHIGCTQPCCGSCCELQIYPLYVGGEKLLLPSPLWQRSIIRESAAFKNTRKILGFLEEAAYQQSTFLNKLK